jgi:cysteinyl-tRNA synthetase
VSPSTQLRLFNTASRSKEVFTLPEGVEAVRMYCCGPTVYHYAHIGNLRSYMFEDFLRRTLEYCGFGIKHVINITDVGHLTSDGDVGEDKMEKGAARTGKSVWEVADYYTQAFMADYSALNIKQPSLWCKATDHIKEQIELVQELERKGYTYQTSDGVYFDSLKFDRYADFGKLDIENLQEGARIDKGEKRNATDFALWKFSPQDTQRQMEWPSPWGVGFPGWHIECSAMAMHHLGHTLDIHCGGSDHIKVHHTNEIAQSECASGHTFSRFWLHGEFLRVDNDKMSKSSGEFLTLTVLCRHGYHPLDYRYFALGSHYRSFLNFTFEAMDGAKSARKSLHTKLEPLIAQAAPRIESPKALDWQAQFKAAIEDDVNVPKALGILHSLLKDLEVADAEKGALALDFDRVFGLEFHKSYSEVCYQAPAAEMDGDFVVQVEALIAARAQARTDKNWAESDRIRDALKDLGVVVKDGKDGVTWEKLS